ncbi:beta-galactosidase [Lachnoclostridium sp. Marseille-P6806]|uniref:beta-galactosidase n=1 Tax=Lachnoclostridium sp. Marseille-P6806 TaxID=2364793 RepID=UPI00102F487D|nr:beta-galactosidase [Lachnoclostridium sp. Marseille-P6806]
MSYLLNGDRIIMGTDYYPEHWDSPLWEEDLDRMLDTGIEVVRVAEFAWSKFEPREGEYDFDFFDGFLALCERKGMRVIFCTPTATPPAWLTEQYPEVLNARMDGVLYRHGARRHYNYNSSVYQRFVSDIVTRLAEHYGPHPAVIGWQIDNEINCETNEFYSESDTAAFREFLKAKYGTVGELNRAWGTVFWNQTYTAWGEVHVPRTTLSGATNPHEVLDYKRFVSDSACRWAKLQSDILRRYIKPDDFITTNGIFGDLDNHRMAEESLDFMTYDSYPNMAYGLDPRFVGNRRLKDRQAGISLSEVRALQGRFGIMEQQSGANGWNTAMAAPTPRPGQITLWTMQSIAHGADYISYFRWRTATMGTEIYWHGILDYSGRDNRRLAEVRDIAGKLRAVSELAGSKYRAEVGILETYDNRWDAELDAWHRLVETTSREGIFSAAQYSHTPVDFVYLREGSTAKELAPYKLLFYPHAVIVNERHAALLRAYVEQGGTLVLGCRAGYKDETGQCVQTRLPGLLQELTGTDVTEYTLIAPEEGRIFADWGGTQIEAAVFTDELSPLGDARVLARYTNSYYRGVPALIEKRTGAGRTLYFGGAFTEETARVFLEKLGVFAPERETVELPECCELAVREKNGEKYYFLLNYSREEARCELKQELRNLYTGERLSGELVLPGYGTAVLKA